MRLLIEGRLEAESRNQNCLDSIEGGTQESRPTETPYAEDGTYGVVGGRGLVTPSYPIALGMRIYSAVKVRYRLGSRNC